MPTRLDDRVEGHLARITSIVRSVGAVPGVVTVVATDTEGFLLMMNSETTQPVDHELLAAQVAALFHQASISLTCFGAVTPKLCAVESSETALVIAASNDTVIIAALCSVISSVGAVRFHLMRTLEH